ncbi:MAG: site-specific integrase [Lachnospiraceae bacterium]|nr:site-specific integrase [Lachnospiraceae bacterium]
MWSEDLPNGKVRFAERYTDPMTGKQKKVSITLDKNTAATRKQAQAALADKISAKLLSAQTNNTNLRLSELIELYRKSQLVTVTKSTYSRNYHAANTIMRLLGESTLVSQLSAAYVKDRFLAQNESPGTFNERLSRFKALIRWGYENDYISDIRYLDKIKPLNNKEKKERLRNKFLEAGDLKKLLDAMTVTKWRYLSELTVLSGMRCGEAIALHMSDVDFENKVISVTKTYDAVNKVVTPPKTACSNREIYMQPELEKLCREIRKHTLSGKLKYGYDADLFMCGVNGGHLDYYAYNKYLGEVSMRTLGRKITTHVMRHTHVSLMAEAGVPLDVITRRVGHENSNVTRDVYLHITERQKEKDRERLNSVIIL